MSTATGWTIKQRVDRSALLRDIAARLGALAGADECPAPRRAVLWRHARDVGDLAGRVAGRGIDPGDPDLAAGLAAELSGLGREAAGIGRELRGIAVKLTEFYGPAGV